MPRHLHLDFETFSQIDLRDVGAYRYAWDSSTAILCAAMALDDDEPLEWHRSLPQSVEHRLEPYWDALENPDVLIYAHNAMFEAAISQALMFNSWGIHCPDLSRFRCTMSLARRAALPSKLEKLAEVLGLMAQKDPRGKKLINRFCVMQKGARVSKKNPQGGKPFRIRPEDEPEAFRELVEYCKQDVRAEQEVARKLAFFDDPINNANYSLDAVVNARGVTVNLPALRHAQKLLREETEIVSQKFRELTGFEVTQNAVFLDWLHSEGVHLDNLQAETVDSFLEKLDGVESVDVVMQALRLKQSVAYAAVKKIPTMIECAGPHDNRIRGLLSHHGATTGRWTSNLVQVQNFARSKIKDSDDAYAMICAGEPREMIELCHGPVLEVIASSIRHFIQDEPRMLLDADYAAIEARVICWLAGQEDALEEYRQGVDRYKRMASVIYGIDEKDVNKFPQRFLGKSAVLGAGYQMGASKFHDTCKKMGYEPPAGLAEKAIKAFRAKHDKVVRFWYDCERAAKRAIIGKGQVVTLRNIGFLHRDVEGFPFLLIRLPSGRKLACPRPRVSDDRIVFFGHQEGTQWGAVDTYGGKIVEWCTQATAADIMANGAHQAERAGYEIATLIHDQALAYHKPGQTPEELIRLLTTLPEWAKGLPIAAEGGLVPYYRKD